MCQAFHSNPLFSGVYKQTAEKKLTNRSLGIHSLGATEGTYFNKILNSQLFFKIVSSTKRNKGISLVI